MLFFVVVLLLNALAFELVRCIPLENHFHLIENIALSTQTSKMKDLHLEGLGGLRQLGLDKAKGKDMGNFESETSGRKTLKAQTNFDGDFRVSILTVIPSIEKVRNPNYPSGSTTYDYSPFWVIGSNYWAMTINSNGGLNFNGRRLFVNVSVFNIGIDSAYAYNRTRDAILGILDGGRKPHVLFGPWPPAMNIPLAQAADDYGGILITGGSGSDYMFMCDPNPIWSVYSSDCVNKVANQRRFQNFFSVMHAMSQLWRPVISELALKGGKSVACVWDDSDPASYLIASNACQFAQSQYGLSGRLFKAPLPMSPSAGNDFVSNIRSFNVDAVFISLFAPDSCVNVFDAFKNINWMPKMLGGDTCLNYLQLATSPSSYFVVNTRDWDPNLRGEHYQESDSSFPWQSIINKTTGAVITSSPMVFAEQMSEWLQIYVAPAFGLNITNYMDIFAIFGTWHPFGYGAAQGLVSHKAFKWISDRIETVNSVSIDSISTSQVRIALMSLAESSFWGSISFDQFGRLIVGDDFTAVQYRGPVTGTNIAAGSFYLIAPLSSSTESLIYPAPSFNERNYSPEGYNTPQEIAILIATGLCMIYCIVILILIFIYHDKPAIRSASWNFCVFLPLGGIIMLLSNFFWTLTADTVACNLRVWFISMGFIILFVPLFAKTWRLYRIFSTNKLSMVVITANELYMIILIACICEFILIITWSQVSPFTAERMIMDKFRPINDIMICNIPNSFVATSLILKAFVLLFGVVLTFLTRKLPRQFNEARYIVTCMYNIFLIGLITIPVLAAPSIDDQTKLIIRSVGIMCFVLSTLSILFIPKFMNLNNVLVDSMFLSTVGSEIRLTADEWNAHRHELSSLRNAYNLLSNNYNRAMEQINLFAQELNKNNLKADRKYNDLPLVAPLSTSLASSNFSRVSTSAGAGVTASKLPLMNDPKASIASSPQGPETKRKSLNSFIESDSLVTSNRTNGQGQSMGPSSSPKVNGSAINLSSIPNFRPNPNDNSNAASPANSDNLYNLDEKSLKPAVSKHTVTIHTSSDNAGSN